jgi:hypothetical protein
MMTNKKYLFVGGLMAMGLDETGQYLLTVTHSGRGVFDTRTWERVARDAQLAYPTEHMAEGIGPLAGKRIGVAERDEEHERIVLQSRAGDFALIGQSDGIEVQFGSEQSAGPYGSPAAGSPSGQP